MRARSLILLTVLSAGALAFLIGLGVWQIQRLHWKEGLIAEIDARIHAEPISLEELTKRARAGEDVSYTRVRVEGKFDNDKERYLFAVSDGTPGWHVIAPLTTPDGEVVLVDRGFVPDAFRDPATRQKGELGGTVTVTGLARPPETQGLFIPDNEVEKNRWFWRDLKTMTLSMFGSGGKDVAPFFVEAERADVPGGWPLGGQTRVDLPNNHLQYAITWFGIALCLVVVYVVYVLGWLKAARSPAAGQAPDSL